MKFFELTLFVSKKENPSGFGISELNPKRDALMDYFDFGEKINAVLKIFTKDFKTDHSNKEDKSFRNFSI